MSGEDMAEAVTNYGPYSQHPLLKDGVKVVHEHVGLVWLGTVLIPNSHDEDPEISSFEGRLFSDGAP